MLQFSLHVAVSSGGGGGGDMALHGLDTVHIIIDTASCISNPTDLDPVTMSPLLKQVTLQTDWAGSMIV